jgi:hypothetical protein
MTSEYRADWRPPTDADWRRLRTLLRDVRTYLERDAAMFAQAEQDQHVIGGEDSAGRIRGYRDRARRACELATRVADELGALSGSGQRKVPLDERGMFTGQWLP